MAAPIQYRAQKRREITERRRQLAGLRCSGVYDQALLAETLGVSVRTVQADLAEIEQQWRQETVLDTDRAKALDVARSEELLRGLWPDVQQGKPRAGEVARSVLEYRARLLGLNASEKREVTVDARLRGMTDDELDAYIAGLAGGAGATRQGA